MNSEARHVFVTYGSNYNPRLLALDKSSEKILESVSGDGPDTQTALQVWELYLTPNNFLGALTPQVVHRNNGILKRPKQHLMNVVNANVHQGQVIISP